MALPFFTIGHSNRSLKAFVALLREVDIALVADIRKMPRSRTNPQFNKETLPEALADFQISYEHMAALGGLRGKTRYTLTEPLLAALEHLLDEGRKRRCTDRHS